MEKLLIFDTTMRDGDQTALGQSMNIESKLELGLQLRELGVDIIEAGMPVNGKSESDAVARVAREVKGPIIAALARAIPGDIDAAWEAVQYAESPRIHLFLPSSDIMLMHQVRKDRKRILEMAVAGVRYAKRICSDIEFSPMDATRTEPAYLYDLIDQAVNAGATTINIPDSVGYALPSQYGELIRGVFRNVPSLNRDHVCVSVHCHNDLGLAMGNTIAGIEAGARQVEGCINGIGERAGNVPLEEVIMVVHTRGDNLGVYTGVNTREIMKTSALVRRITGLNIQPNKAIVGSNAFAHESGIHQDALIKNRQTFEIIDPALVGSNGILQIPLGATSGTSAVIHEVWRILGIDITKAHGLEIRNQIVERARAGGAITDDILREMVEGVTE